MPVYIIIGTHRTACRELIAQAGNYDLDDLLPEPWQEVHGADQLWPADGTPPEPAATLFCCLDPAKDLADEIETVQEWSRQSGNAIDRVIGVVDSAAAEKSAAYARWVEACAHFSDALVWANRETVSQKWLRAFQKQFDKLCFPCSYHLLKKGGRVDDPRLLFFPEARRLSKAFDPAEPTKDDDGPISPLDLIEIDASFDLDDADSDTEVEDYWLARHESGHRRQRLPDIQAWIVD